MTRYIVESDSDKFLGFRAFQEGRPNRYIEHSDPQLALKFLLERERIEDTLARGSRVVIYEGMGNQSYGVSLGRNPRSGNLKVLYDGSIDPDGTRHEPYVMSVNYSAVSADPEGAAAKRDEERWIPGHTRIEAKIDE